MKMIEKKPDNFAIILIVIYVVGSLVLQSVSESIGIEYLCETIFVAALSVFLFVFAKRNSLMERIGLKKSEVPAAKALFYIPLLLIALCPAFFGIEFTTSRVLCTIMMLFVGFVEEVIFRGFLFKGLAKNNLKSAIIISAVTFGIGHIVNLLNGYDIFSSVAQIVYALACGFLLVMIYVRTDSIIFCIVFHSLNNMVADYADAKILVDALGEQNARLVTLGIRLAIILGYTAYIVKCLPKREIVPITDSDKS